MTVKNTFLEIIGTDMTVQKGFFENYRGGHDVWADMTTENTVYITVKADVKIDGFFLTNHQM